MHTVMKEIKHEKVSVDECDRLHNSISVSSSASDHSPMQSPVSSSNFARKLSALEKSFLMLKEKNAMQEEKLNNVTKELKELKKKNSNPEPDENYHETRIYVGNIAPSTMLTELRMYYSKYGSISDAFFFREFPNCKNAFVDFVDSESATKAIKGHNYLNKRYLTTGRAKRRLNNLASQANKENIHDDIVHNFKLKKSSARGSRYNPY